MPSVNQVQNLMPSGGQGVQIPLDIKQRMLAEQLAQETAAAPKKRPTRRKRPGSCPLSRAALVA